MNERKSPVQSCGLAGRCSFVMNTCVCLRYFFFSLSGFSFRSFGEWESSVPFVRLERILNIVIVERVLASDVHSCERQILLGYNLPLSYVLFFFSLERTKIAVAITVVCYWLLKFRFKTNVIEGNRWPADVRSTETLILLHWLHHFCIFIAMDERKSLFSHTGVRLMVADVRSTHSMVCLLIFVMDGRKSKYLNDNSSTNLNDSLAVDSAGLF